MRVRLRPAALLLIAAAACLPLAGAVAAGFAWPQLTESEATTGEGTADMRQLRLSLKAAQAAAAQASNQARRQAAQANRAVASQERARLELTALAGRLQEAEAQTTLAEARLALVEEQRRALDRTLAARREPLVQLAAALQRLAVRPLALSALQPASLRETVYLRAVLSHAVPAVQQRTTALRADLARSRALAAEQQRSLSALVQGEARIAARRDAVLARTLRSRQAFAQASRAARREEQRAEDMALQTRDLGELIAGFDQLAQRRAELAALPGPVIRPAVGAPLSAPPPAPAAPAPRIALGPGLYRLPVVGRIVAGFGDTDAAGLARTGLSLEPRSGALVVAPGGGRVAFAGPYRGFGAVVILEHGGGWTSLVTGMERVGVAVGQQIAAGAPLGSAPANGGTITLELRRNGSPVNPLPFALRQAN